MNIPERKSKLRAFEARKKNLKNKRRMDYNQNGEHQILHLRNLFPKLFYDLPALQSKKYLFVGHMDNDFGKLKKKFPNTVFMTENANNISNIIVDTIAI